jgi:SAM-dependent methyltransferase
MMMQLDQPLRRVFEFSQVNERFDMIFSFSCPDCDTPLVQVDENQLFCTLESRSYWHENGIWRFLSSERQEYFRKFLNDYETIRRLEGRGSDNSEYYKALPFKDLSGKWQRDWQIRSRSYNIFLKSIVIPLESQINRPIKIIDMGAGNGWLSNRLALRGHHSIALDLVVNAFDGLGAFRHYDSEFIPIQAEFDRLPFIPGQFDLVIFNASIHYSINYQKTIEHTKGKLAPNGIIVILDTPIYKYSVSGTKMVEQREMQFISRYGFPSNALPIQSFLTWKEIDLLAKSQGITWKVLKPFYGIDWFVRQWLVRLKDRREPANFHILIGTNS